MGLSVNNNTAAYNTYRNLTTTQGQLSKSLEKLSSGYRINRAADDAAGLAISEGLRSQIQGLTQATRNSQDAINVVQTAEGSLSETHSILQRVRDLAVQSANDSNDTTSRAAINEESTALKAELDRIADKTTFNNIKVLDGNYNNKQFQVGYAANDTINVSVTSTGTGGAVATAGNAVFTQGGVATTVALTASTDANNIATQLNADTGFAASYTAKVSETGGLQVTSKTGQTGAIAVTGTLTAAGTNAAAGANAGFSSADLGLTSVDLSSKAGANAAISKIDDAIKAVSTSRAQLGALQNRFEHTINNLNVTAENLSASESRIRDTDMAQEMMSFTRSQILSQAGTAMLAQANSAPQGVLSLLRG